MDTTSKLPLRGLAFALLAVLIAGFAAVVDGRTAVAHQDPADCEENGVGMSLAALRSDMSTIIIGGATVQSGEQIFYRATLSKLPDPNCSFGGGPDGQVDITTPDGVLHTVVAAGGVSHVTDGSPFVAPLQSYTVSEADVTAGNLMASADYFNGISHTGGATDFDLAGHDTASATVDRNIPYQDVALEVTKDAAPAFEVDCTWDITKSVNPAHHDLLVGESADSTYTVEVTKTCVEGNVSVSGEITIFNPAEFADAEITQVADMVDGIAATVDCPGGIPQTLPAGETLICTYSADLPDESTRTNTATVTTSGDVGGGEGTAEVNFEAVEPTDVSEFPTVNVQDVFDGGAPDPLGTISDSETFIYDRTFTCDEPGDFEFPNTASIVETGQSADALVTVTCEEIVTFAGCTPGFWKNHTDLWQGYTPEMTLGSVFVFPASLSDFEDDTLLEALNYGGGPGVDGGARILLRAAVASLLNAAHADVSFTMTEAEVIDAVNAALASEDRQTLISLAGELDADNNIGCSIDAQGRPINSQ